MGATTQGLVGVVDDTVGLYVQDDSPEDERRYRDGPHAIEIDLVRASDTEAFDGTFELLIDGVSMIELTPRPIRKSALSHRAPTAADSPEG
jgi:hypothetical protein